MIIQRVYPLYSENQGFVLDHRRFEDHYVFVHFLSSVITFNDVIIKPGACIMYKPFSHRYFRAETEPLLHDWFHATGNIEELADKYGVELNKFYYPNNDDIITRIIQDIEIEKLLPSPFSESFYSLKVEELIMRIAQGSCQPHPTDSDTYERFLQLRSKIQKEYYKIHDVAALSDLVGLSPSRFFVLYKKIFGVSPKQDLINIRIEHAKYRLKQRQYTVTELAESIGYTNPYHFIRQFKQMSGVSPLQYAKKYSYKYDEKD